MPELLVVVEGSAEAFRHAVDEAAAAGWQVAPGLEEPVRAPRLVRTASVATRSDAATAVRAAMAGQNLILRAMAPREVIDRLIDDLGRLGRVDHRIGPAIERSGLEPQARAILGLLAEGYSLGDAAAILGISRRAADRRLAGGRRALGASRTTEAIARARRLGWLREKVDRPPV
jgi:DNA-binding NarL/FixJ family response regulator